MMGIIEALKGRLERLKQRRADRNKRDLERLADRDKCDLERFADQLHVPIALIAARDNVSEDQLREQLRRATPQQKTYWSDRIIGYHNRMGGNQ